MKLTLVIGNLVAPVLLFFLGCFAVAAHRTHGYSVYKELQANHVLVERGNYDVAHRIETVADGGKYSLWIAEIGSAFFVMNAAAVAFLFKETKKEN